MVSRNEAFLSAAEAVQNGASIEVIGTRGSGRSYTMSRLREHFVRLGWRVIDVNGSPGLIRAPFSALIMAGIVDAEARGGPLTNGTRALSEKILPARTVIVIDDADAVDESSWGALTAVSSQHNVPLAFSRVQQPAPWLPGAAQPVSALYSVPLGAMSYSELEIALESTLSLTLDPTTMSRIFALSGGSIGPAVAIVQSARRGGGASVSRGTLRVSGPLWNPGLGSMCESLFAALPENQVEALRNLALMGAAEVHTATRLVTAPVVFDLEARGLLRFVETREGRLATVDPPILAEYFRHQTGPGQRAMVRARIDQILSGDEAMLPDPLLVDDGDDDAMFVRLVHEHLRRRTLLARRRWEQTPGLATATPLLQALAADVGTTTEETNDLLARARHLTALPQERADWAIARASYTAHHDGRPIQAVADLRQTASEVPLEALRLTAEAAVLEMGFGPIPEQMPLAHAELSECDDAELTSVLLAQLMWLVAMGRVREADELATEYAADQLRDPRLDTIVTVTKIAMGEISSSAEHAHTRLNHARADFDATRLRVYAFLSAITSVLTRRFDEAEAALTAPTSLGGLPGEAPLSFVGLSVISAYVAADQGSTSFVDRFLGDLEASGLPDGPFPGLQRALVRARLVALEGHPEQASRISRELGDELWDRGARLAAAVAYLDGLRTHPSAADWAHAHPRVAQIDSPLVQHWAALTTATVDRDIDGVSAVIEDVLSTHEDAHAAQLAEIALRVLASERATSNSDRLSALQAIVAAHPRSTASTSPDFSARELEVAELIASGLSNPMIAETLVVSVRTVESHINKMLRKLNAAERNDIREYVRSLRATRSKE